MREEFKNSDLWHKRFLPHYNASDKFQMITYRLADSIPEAFLKNLLGAPHSDAGEEIQRRKSIEEILDQSHGSCLLAYPQVASKVIEAWKYFHNTRYDLIANVVMPNHVHVLIKSFSGFDLGKIVWSWKRHVSKFVFENITLTAKFDESFKLVSQLHENSRAPLAKQRFLRPASECRAPSKNKSLWQREYWDRYIRDENHFIKAVEYIHQNPVKAGLVSKPEDWKWSSCS